MHHHSLIDQYCTSCSLLITKSWKVTSSEHRRVNWKKKKTYSSHIQYNRNANGVGVGFLKFFFSRLTLDCISLYSLYVTRLIQTSTSASECLITVINVSRHYFCRSHMISPAIRTSNSADRANEQQAVPSGVIITQRNNLLRSSQPHLAEMRLLLASSPVFRRYFIFCLLYRVPCQSNSGGTQCIAISHAADGCSTAGGRPNALKTWSITFFFSFFRRHYLTHSQDVIAGNSVIIIHLFSGGRYIVCQTVALHLALCRQFSTSRGLWSTWSVSQDFQNKTCWHIMTYYDFFIARRARFRWFRWEKYPALC